VSRQPKPGEWWFSPDGTMRRCCVGIDTTGDPIWEVFDEHREYVDVVDPNWVYVPDCDSWEWELPAMPIGWELCGPPTDAVESTLTRVWDDGTWDACHPDYINASAYTYCRRPKSADLGPQKEPSSVARIAAQLRQVLMDLEKLEVVSDVD